MIQAKERLEGRHPEAMMSWADYMYTLQGAYGNCLGIEGESCTRDEEGHIHADRPDSAQSGRAEQCLRYSVYPGGRNPALLTDDTFKGSE